MLCCPIVELRQYTLVPSKRDDFINFFETQFVETQEAAGMTVIGQFRVIENPNSFFWIRGFADMPRREQALTTFYHGPVWKTYRSRANSMLVENDNVLLLHQAHDGSGFPAPTAPRAPLGSTIDPPGIIAATMYYLGSNLAATFDSGFEKTIRPLVTEHGARVMATFATDNSPNNYPSLPIRTDANLFVWFSCFPSESAYEAYANALIADSRWAEVRSGFALAHMYIQPEVWLLQATPRSQLHC